MKTIFWLFENYAEAKAAVAELSARGFDETEMNAIALAEVVKDVVDVNWKAVEVQVTDKIGEQTLEGLDRLFGGEQPAKGLDVGKVFAAGTLATLVTKTALAFGGKEGGFRDALADLNVPENLASAFVDGIKQRGVLFWVRCSDDQAAQATSAMEDRQATIAASYVHA
jgi:hypothetical protein